MKTIVVFLLVFLAALTGALIYSFSDDAPGWVRDGALIVRCALIGGMGGVAYCLRGVYVNACVHKRWDDDWRPWYFIRPFVSVLCGGVSWLFLKAGLLLLEADKSSESSDLGFYALAFIAGLNVDKFISKIEDIAQAAWGIEKSRAAKEKNPNE